MDGWMSRQRYEGGSHVLILNVIQTFALEDSKHLPWRTEEIHGSFLKIYALVGEF